MGNWTRKEQSYCPQSQRIRSYLFDRATYLTLRETFYLDADQNLIHLVGFDEHGLKQFSLHLDRISPLDFANIQYGEQRIVQS